MFFQILTVHRRVFSTFKHFFLNCDNNILPCFLLCFIKIAFSFEAPFDAKSSREIFVNYGILVKEVGRLSKEKNGIVKFT